MRTSFLESSFHAVTILVALSGLAAVVALVKKHEEELLKSLDVVEIYLPDTSKSGA